VQLEKRRSLGAKLIMKRTNRVAVFVRKKPIRGSAPFKPELRRRVKMLDNAGEG
jgi:hypothetical protein